MLYPTELQTLFEFQRLATWFWEYLTNLATRFSNLRAFFLRMGCRLAILIAGTGRAYQNVETMATETGAMPRQMNEMRKNDRLCASW